MAILQALSDVGGRITASAFSRRAERLEASFGTSLDRCRAEARRIMAAADVELVEVIRLRDDDRGVFLVSHPVHGRCILKTSFPARSASSGLANLQISRWLQETNPPVFPRVLEAAADHSFEQYIDGPHFRKWMGTDFHPGPFANFLKALRLWSESTGGPWEAQDRLQPHEVRSIMAAYVDKVIGQSRYLGFRRRIAGLARLRAREDDLRRRIERLSDQVERIAIPRGVMCGDMGHLNLMVERKTHRIYNIDYEFMQPGHRGFDCAYLLAALARLPADQATLSQIGAMALAPEYLGGPEIAEFFTEYADILVSLTRTISGQQPLENPLSPRPLSSAERTSPSAALAAQERERTPCP